jgi:aryl-alcohol dehydrogenase-like predicted oxidoreductase
MKYSLMTCVPEKNGVLHACRKLGISFIAYSPLSRALLTDKIPQQSEANDFQQHLPRFQGDNFEYNKMYVEKAKKIAQRKKSFFVTNSIGLGNSSKRGCSYSRHN